MSAAPQIEAELAALRDLREKLDAAVPLPSGRAQTNPPRLHTGDTRAAGMGLESAIRNRNAGHLRAIASNAPVASGLTTAEWHRARLALFGLQDPKAHRDLLELESRLRPVAAELEVLAHRVRAATP